MRFDFEIIYRSGKLNIVADMLSISGYIITQAEIEDKDQARKNNLIWVTAEEQLQLIRRVYKGSVGHLWEEKLFQAIRLRFW